MKRKLAAKALIALVCAAVLTGAMALGVAYQPDQMLADFLYQRPRALDGNILIVGIDDRAMADIGPYHTWGRDVMAMVIETLNAEEATRPAVIGVDVLYTGESDPALDDYLADAAGAHGNVVVASAAQFGSRLVTEGEDFYLDDYAVLAYEEPYEALRSVTGQGHINAMYDGDGVLRHGILTITAPDGRTIPSFAYAIYQKYTGKTLDVPTDRQQRFYVDLSAKPGGFSEGISVADILAGDYPAELFRDAIVLIGPYAVGLSDHVTTAMDRSTPMYGVEYQANIIAQMLDGRFKQEVRGDSQALGVFLLTTSCLFVFLTCKLRISLPLWLAAAGGCIPLCRALYGAGYVLHPLWLPLSVTLGFIGAVGYQYVQAALEKRWIAHTFKHYVAPEIVNELLAQGRDGLELGGKLCDIAVLFVDIRGFTTMSEVLTPQEVVSILNRYLSLTTDCIMQYHGTLDKFVGDCTMAIWNAPVPQDDYVMNACRAAVAMVKRSQALSQELLDQFGRTVSFGVGIHCGSAVVGNIGAKMRMDFTAIGDTVNTAARLESNAPAGTIYISREVAERLAGRIRVTSLGDGITLKGKAQKMEIFRLEDVAE